MKFIYNHLCQRLWRSRLILAVFILVLVGLSACSKFVDLDLPADKIAAETVFASDNSLISALNGVYGTISNSTDFITPAYFADELTFVNASGSTLDAQQNSYSAETDYQYFTNYYRAIYEANAILDALPKSTGLSAPVIAQARGESLFLRAFAYFKLVNFYGTVPLIQSPDVAKSALKGNTSIDSLYTAIIKDLTDAGSLLTDTYPKSTRIRVNRGAVNALLAKVCLYSGNWPGAVSAATAVLNDPQYRLEADPNMVFKSGSTETIWQLWNPNGYTSVAGTFIPVNTAAVFYRIRPGLIAAFEPGDLRLQDWIRQGTGEADTLYYPYKYRNKSLTTGTDAEYLVVSRLSEQYLIRAEALAQLDQLSQSKADLDQVRVRAGLDAVVASDKNALISAIWKERQTELMFENGDRWFDLNRTGRAASVLKAAKGSFPDYAVLLPFPTDILLHNPNLNQNEGYKK